MGYTWQVTVYMEDGSTREKEYLDNEAKEMGEYIAFVTGCYKLKEIKIVRFDG